MSAPPPDRDALARLVAALNAKLVAVQTDLANLLLWLAGSTESVSPPPAPQSTSDHAPGLTASSDRRRTPYELAIIGILHGADSPMCGDALATALGKRKGTNGYFRERLAEMVRDGVLQLFDDGYWLADRELP